jgi:predicted adenine nucleotide alpha hydrolase (AANH) superfamily ATPase
MKSEEKEEYRQYLQSRKSSHKTNYYQLSLQEIEAIRASGTKPKLLLHACCGPCAGWPLEFLHDVFAITILYNNANIYPQAEYERRRDELLRLLPLMGYDDIEVVVPPYDNITYTKEVLAERKDDPEGWKRCFHCYEVRMEEGFRYAEQHGFPWFTTVMTISRQKDSQVLNAIGRKLAEKHPSVRYFYSDFKKAGGQNRRDEIVRTYDLYHQDYCGCVYSYTERQKKIG